MKIIAIEGIDGSGKATQAKRLEEELRREGYRVEALSFPRYADPASIYVRRYLEGEYGEDPDAIDPHAAALFYALDRYDYFRRLKEEPEILIVDRYTPSNMIHQSSKLEDREAFNAWLEELEYKTLGIPKPDQVIFLDLPTHLSEKLMRTREETTKTQPDIHESDRDYLKRSHACARDLARSRGWTRIACNDGESIRDIEDIAREIRERVDV